MNDLNCLNNIIGLSQNECVCYDDGRPVDFDKSNSGLYLDELEGLNLRTLASDVECGEGNIWLKMEKAITNAINNFRTDLLSSIMLTQRNARKPFQGIIGQLKFKTFNTIPTTWTGLRINPREYKGSVLTIKGITALMDSTVVFDVFIYDNISPTPLHSILNVNATTGTATKNPLTNPIDLPLYVEGYDDDSLQYFVVYQPSGFNPLDNKISCGCRRTENFESWLTIEGIQGDVIADREDWNSNGFANGLALDVTTKCNVAEIICGGDSNDSLDFENDGVALSMAYAIRFKAGEILIEDILASGEINRFTMLDKERLWGKRNHYRTEFRTRIVYISDTIDIDSNDCLVCGDKRINRSSILT